MKRYLLTILCVFPLVLSAADSTSYVEKFSNNKREWWTGEDADDICTLDKGVFTWTSKREDLSSYSQISQPLQYDESGNYEIAVRLKVGGPDGAMAGMFWGLVTDPWSGYEYVITADGKVRISCDSPNKYVEYQPLRDCPYVKIDDFNDLVVRKIGSEWIFLLNDKVVGVAPYIRPLGQRLALRTGGKATAVFDQLSEMMLPGSAADHDKLAESYRSSYTALRAENPSFTEPLLEEFDDNRNQWDWIGDTDGYLGEIENGHFIFENFSLDGTSVYIPSLAVHLPEGVDYQISSRFKWTTEKQEGNAGLVLGENPDNGARVDFIIDRVRDFMAQTNAYGDGWRKLVAWANFEGIKPDDFNELTVTRIDNYTFYAINGQTVAAPYQGWLPGKQFGYYVPSATKIEVDYLRIRYLDDESGGDALSSKLKGEARAFHVSKGGPLNGFDETFDTNDAGWVGIVKVEGKWNSELRDGIVHCENTDELGRLIVRRTPVNYRADYDISLRARMAPGGDPRLAISLCWARSGDTLKSRLFSFADSGYYQLWGHDAEGNSVVEIPWRQTTAVKAGEFNELRVRRVGDTLYIFINGQILADAPIGDLEGTMLGLYVNSGNKADIDDFHVRYHETGERERVEEAQRLAVALKAAHNEPALGALYSVLVAQEKAIEEAKKSAEEYAKIPAPRVSKTHLLTKADQKYREKLFKRYNMQKVGSAWADLKKPTEYSADGYTFYYFYKRIDGTDFYLEFWAQQYRNEDYVERTITGVDIVDVIR